MKLWARTFVLVLLAPARGSLADRVERLDAAYANSPIVAILPPEVGAGRP